MNKSIKFKRDGNVYYPYSYYPVGFFYITDSDISPASIYGGTWELIKDKFLLGCGDTFILGATGGEINHTLTADELAEHSHTYYRDKLFVWDNTDLGDSSYNNVSIVEHGATTSTVGVTGGNQPHNNMPPYIAVYIWHRIA